MSSVYLAIQQSIGREVALKVMSPTLAQDANFSERFQREATIVGQLSHPNIISIYDIGKHQGLNYIAMDYLAKGSLSQRLQKGISGLEAVKILKQLASALAHAHRSGYVHRDIKPENVLFRADDSAVLSDFGVAKAIKQNLGVTHAGTVLGTPNYMSPEQAKGQPCDGRSDLYSLGVMFYEMLSAKLPFQAEEAVAIAIKHLTAPIPKLPAQHALFQPLINDLLAKNSTERIQSGEELIERIEVLESGLQMPRLSQRPASEELDLKLGIHQRLQALVFFIAHKFHRPSDKTEELLRQASRYTTAINQSEASPSSENNKDDDNPTFIGKNQHLIGKNRYLIEKKRRLLSVVAGLSALGLATFFYLYPSTPDATIAGDTVANKAGSNNLTVNDPKPLNEQDTAQLSDKLNTANAKLTRIQDTESKKTGDVNSSSELNTDKQLLVSNQAGSISQIKQDIAVSAIDAKDNFEGASSQNNSLPPKTIEAKATPANEQSALATYPLKISSTPKADRIRILNIKPRYKNGILLSPGNYLIEITKKNFKTLKQWLRVKDRPINRQFTLKEVPVAGSTFSDKLDDFHSAPEMIVIPSGSFSMGSKSNSNSLPIRQVTISESFAVSRFEISFSDYQVYLNDSPPSYTTPDDKDWGRGNRPVINISWEEAVAYTQWLSKKTGRKYRLLSEAEWEYVARANHAGNYWWPNNSRRMANCRRGCNSDFSTLFGSQTSPLGYYPANPFGVYDTAGNVAEWVLDCYTAHYLGASSTSQANKNKNCQQKTVRGGSHKDSIEKVSSHSRSGVPGDSRHDNIGFRIYATP